MDCDVLLPPAANWFSHHTFHVRQADSLIAVASFRNVVIYKIELEVKYPTILKTLTRNDGRVTSVRLFSDPLNPNYGNNFVSTTDQKYVSLWDIKSGEVIKSHQQHKGNITGCTWAELGGENVIVSIGGNGQIAVWDPKQLSPQMHTLSHFNDLTFVETLPHRHDQVLVAAEKVIVHVSLKDGGVLNQFKGHDMDIYTLSWYTGGGCPLDKNNDTNMSLPPSEVLNDEAEESHEENQSLSWRNKSEEKPKTSETTSWRDRSDITSDVGPFFATSDLSRNILIWSFSSKRYLLKINAPYCSSSTFKKPSRGARQQIALAWYNNKLITSSVQGEILSWKLEPNGAALETIHHLHTRVVYNIAVVHNVVVSSSQDRQIIGYRLDNSNQVFQVPCLGNTCCTMAIYPLDPNRIAIGVQENAIRILSLDAPTPLGYKVYSNNIKGKVIALNWHPTNEGWLLFGTSDGQIGYLDVNTGKVNQFAYFHQKSAYKVEWAPRLPYDSSDEDVRYEAYSFGDHQMLMHSMDDLNAEPIKVKCVLPENQQDKFLKDITEFSFSADYKYLAIGAQDGQIQVFLTSNMNLLVTYTTLRKPIQHILWKPPTTDDASYTFVVGSNDPKICIFELEDALSSDNDIITQASKELHGHASRVVWLSWSTFTNGLLASGSYDRSVIIWDTETGKRIGTYEGHAIRLYRVEFSLNDPDTLFSFGDESSFHMWTLSRLNNNALEKKKDNLVKKKSRARNKELEDNSNAKESSVSTSTSSISNLKSKTIKRENKPSEKSLFPLYHLSVSKKKQFYHLAALSLAQWHQQRQDTQVNGTAEESLEDGLDDEDMKTVQKEEETIEQLIEKNFEAYEFLHNNELKPECDKKDMAYMLHLFTNPENITEILNREIDNLMERSYNYQASVLHLWKGSVEEQIQLSAENKTLSPFLVSLAPQVSFQLWESACEAYAQQLIDEGEIMAAASYYVSINKVEEAVNLLAKHKYFKEAIAVVKCRDPYNSALLNKTVTHWVSFILLEGNFELAAVLFSSLGDFEQAARTLSRRTDPSSIITAAELYKFLGETERANSNVLAGLKEASIKNDFEKILPCLEIYPDLKWYSAISVCHQEIVQFLENQKLTADSCWKQMHLVQNKCSRCVEKLPEDLCTCSVNDVMTFFDYIKIKWMDHSIKDSQYKDIYDELKKHFSTKQLPNSVKQLWFLVGVSFCKYLMTDDIEDQEEIIEELLNYFVNWGKADQLFHLTHMFLPYGVDEFSSLQLVEEIDDKPAIKLLQLYCLSEISVYLHVATSSEIKNNESQQNKELRKNVGDLTESLDSMHISTKECTNAMSNGDVLTNGSNDNILETNSCTNSEQNLVSDSKENPNFKWKSDVERNTTLDNYESILSDMDSSLLNSLKLSSMNISDPLALLKKFKDTISS